MGSQDQIQIVAKNKKAYHDYIVLETIEAGLVLHGTEVKSIRQGRVNLKDAWCAVKNSEMFLNNMHISPYEQGNQFNRDPLRVRKLLLHKQEIRRLYAQVKQQGLALIPLSLYFRKGKAKLEIGLCRGKKNYDKRHSEAARDAARQLQRHMKQ